jgi:2'-5' RNA ligase
MSTKRTFIASKTQPIAEIKSFVALLRNQLQYDTIKWVDMGNLHITWRFLGDTPVERIDDIAMSLQHVAVLCKKGQLKVQVQMFSKRAGI